MYIYMAIQFKNAYLVITIIIASNIHRSFRRERKGYNTQKFERVSLDTAENILKTGESIHSKFDTFLFYV